MQSVRRADGSSNSEFGLGRAGCVLVATLALSFLALVALGWRVAAYPTGVSDLAAYFLPKYQYAADRLAAGELPYWNPYEFGGIPFIATIQPAVFYPPLRLAYGLLDGESAYVACFFLHIVMAAAGTLLMMRSFGAGLWPAVLASLWVVQPTWLMRVWDHPVYIWGVAWIPILLLLLRELTKRPSPRVAGLLAITAASQVLSGYPPMVLATGYLLLVSLPFLFAEAPAAGEAREIRRFFTFLLIAISCTALITAVQILPTIQLALTTDRAGEAATTAAMVGRLSELGHQMAFWIGVPRPTVGEALEQLWVRFGPFLLALVGAGILLRWRSPLVWLGAAGLVLSALLPLRVYQAMPFSGLVRFALEWDYIAPLMVYTSAGLGLDAIRRRHLGSEAQAALLTFVVAGLTLIWNWQLIDPGWKKIEVDLDLAIPADVLTACQLEDNQYRGFWSLGQWRGGTMRSGVSSISGYEQSLIPARSAQLSQRLGIGNGGVTGSTARLIVRDRHASARMALRCLVMMRSPALEKEGLERIHRSGGRSAGYLFPEALPRARLAFDYRVAASPEEALSLVFSERPEVVILEENPEPMAKCLDVAASTVELIGDAPEHVVARVTTPCPAYLVLADTMAPGWTAQLDGTAAPILRADFAFRAVRVPAGRHTVDFRYDAPLARVGLVLSVLGVLCVLVLVLFGGQVGLRRSDS